MKRHFPASEWKDNNYYQGSNLLVCNKCDNVVPYAAKFCDNCGLEQKNVDWSKFDGFLTDKKKSLTKDR